MRKILFIILAVAMAFFGACTSTGQAGAGSGSSADASNQESEISSEFERIYDEYRGGLILDGAKTYKVVRNDVLNQITRQFYGTNNGFYFPLIMLASSEVVVDPEEIEIGMELTIPDLQRNLNDSGARAKLKSFLSDIAEVYNTKAANEPRRREEHLRTAKGLSDLSNSL